MWKIEKINLRFVKVCFAKLLKIFLFFGCLSGCSTSDLILLNFVENILILFSKCRISTADREQLDKGLLCLKLISLPESPFPKSPFDSKRVFWSEGFAWAVKQKEKVENQKNSQELLQK